MAGSSWCTQLEMAVALLLTPRRTPKTANAPSSMPAAYANDKALSANLLFESLRRTKLKPAVNTLDAHP